MSIAANPQSAQPFHLLAFQGFVDVQRRNGFFFFHGEAVDSYDHSFVAIDLLLIFVGGVLDFLLHETALDSLQHSSEGFNLVQIFQRTLLDFVGESFDEIRSRQWINGLRHSGFVSDDLLRTQSNPRRLLRRQGQGFVVRIGMQRLRTPENRCHGLNCGADNIIFRLLRGQSGAGGLGMKAHHPRAGVLRLEMLAHNASPHAARGAKLGDFFQKITVGVKEKRNARRESIHVEPGVDGGLHIRDAIAQGKGDFLHRCRSGLTHVVPRD